MHICILADTIDNQSAGVHFYTKNLIEELLKIDKNNRYSFIHERPNDFFNNTENYIIKKHKFPGAGTMRKFFLIPKLIRKLKPDIVLEPCHIGPFNLPKSIKRAVTIHDLTPILFPQFHIKRSTIIHKLLLKRVLKNADLILTASQNNKKDIMDYMGSNSKIEVIPLGLSRKITAGGQVQHNSRITQAPYILYLGTIEPRKNLNILIDSFLELKEELKLPHKLVLAGKIGWKAKETVQKARHPEIILTNHVDNNTKQQLYKNADLFVYPSLYEGFGLPPMEALSYGTPTICSTGGALKEVYKNQVSLFNPKDKEKLKQLIKKHLSHRQNGAIKNLPTFKKTAQKTLKALNEAVQKSS